MGIDGTTVLVTGGSGQLGWGVGCASVDAGAHLLPTASRPASAARLADDFPDAGLLVVAVRAQWGLADVLRAELADAPFRFNEVRIRTRIEREEHPGVVPSRTAGDAFVDVMAGDARSQLLHYPA